ncbi:hypothetical protein V2S66_23100 [Streptomyces sp. V4-01]|uniref:Uncharacterized protein n=1 Tax=Actinacidiphila polyblastidii TaxID=3110430 RepID=A0ABU7PHU1_9ACTN|nr:hypothetical protein [Streptomyces sp. V4-01]
MISDRDHVIAADGGFQASRASPTPPPRDRLARGRLDDRPTPGQVAGDTDARDAAPAPN